MSKSSKWRKIRKKMYSFFKEGLKIVDKVNRNAEVIVKVISSIKSCGNRKDNWE